MRVIPLMTDLMDPIAVLLFFKDRLSSAFIRNFDTENWTQIFPELYIADSYFKSVIIPTAGLKLMGVHIRAQLSNQTLVRN